MTENKFTAFYQGIYRGISFSAHAHTFSPCVVADRYIEKFKMSFSRSHYFSV